MFWMFKRKPVVSPEAWRVAFLVAENDCLRATIVYKDDTIAALDSLVLGKDATIAGLRDRLDKRFRRGARGRFAKRAP